MSVKALSIDNRSRRTTVGGSGRYSEYVQGPSDTGGSGFPEEDVSVSPVKDEKLTEKSRSGKSVQKRE